MNSYERIANRLAGKGVDRFPNMSLVMMFAAKLVGVSFGQYCADHRYLVDAAFRCHEMFGLDMVCAISDPMREAEGFGAKVILQDEGVPYSPVKRLQSLADIGTLKVIDPACGSRMNDRLEAVRKMKERAKGAIPVIGWIEGALAECCDLMDMQEVFANLLMEPDAMRELIDICVEQGLRFAKAQVEAGADIIGIGDAATSLIGPPLYEAFVLPYQQMMIKKIHDMGAKVKLHICGDLNPILHLVARTGADIVDLDYMVDMDRAAEILPPSACICGNIDPVTIMYEGTPERIKADAQRCVTSAAGHRLILSTGCEIPRDTPVENVLALRRFLEEC